MNLPAGRGEAFDLVLLIVFAPGMGVNRLCGVSPRVAIIGVFDGVHQGHQALIEQARSLAGAGEVVALTFDPHPLTVVNLDAAPLMLGGIDDRIERLTVAGVDEIIVVDFSTAVSEQSPEEFVREFVHQRARANVVVVGGNFRFGHRALGDAHTLEELGGTYGFSVHDVDLRGDAQTYSSTRARKALLDGDLATVAQVLGRPFSYRGVVVHGDHRGRTLGVPTANINIAADRAAPADGVYAGRVQLPGTQGPPRTAAISVGSNPQYAGTERRIEAHVLDEDDLDLYDMEIDVEFLTRLRGQQVFDSEAAFIEQMQADIRAARAIGEAPEVS